VLLHARYHRQLFPSHSPPLDTPQPKAKAAKASKSPAKKAKKEGPNPANAYMMFSSDNRDAVKAKNPKATFGELGKLIGAMWQKASDSVKADWKKKADAQTAKNAKEFKAKK
jgi:hypothetical protein